MTDWTLRIVEPDKAPTDVPIQEGMSLGRHPDDPGGKQVLRFDKRIFR